MELTSFVQLHQEDLRLVDVDLLLVDVGVGVDLLLVDVEVGVDLLLVDVGHPGEVSGMYKNNKSSGNDLKCFSKQFNKRGLGKGYCIENSQRIIIMGQIKGKIAVLWNQSDPYHLAGFIPTP